MNSLINVEWTEDVAKVLKLPPISVALPKPAAYIYKSITF